MRHYFGYDINGHLKTIEMYGPSGWPLDQRMDDANCEHKGVTSLRASRVTTAPNVVGWVLYDCPCSPNSSCRDCKCINTKFATSFVDAGTKALVDKPLRTILVDNQPVDNEAVITRDPGATVVFKVSSPTMPDGEKALCIQRGSVDIALEDEWYLTFTNGMSEAKTLIAPAQGTRGVVHIGGGKVRPLAFFLRGFAATP